MSDNLAEFKLLSQISELRKLNADLQNNLRKAKAKSEDLVEATLAGAQAAFAAIGPLPPVPSPKLHSANKHKPEVALWHLTDWQGAKVSTTYNSKVMKERVMRFCDIAEEITQVQRQDHSVDDCVILFGGDLIEGLFNYPAQPFEIDASLFGQYAQASHLLAKVIRKALSIYKKVTVIGEWGNHGRIGSKRSAVPTSDNVDRMIYFAAQQMLIDENRLKWQISDSDTQPFIIGNYRAVLMHGDEVGRNGYASPKTIVDHVAKWKSGAYRIDGKVWPFRDAYGGHFHTHSEWALPDGEGAFYQTGSPESDNRFAGTHMASSAVATQRLHFIDPRKGRVGPQHKIYLS